MADDDIGDLSGLSDSIIRDGIWVLRGCPAGFFDEARTWARERLEAEMTTAWRENREGEVDHG